MSKDFRLWVTVLRWVDADTFVGILDQGYGTYRGRDATPVRFRCARINAPEMSTPQGPLARSYAEELAPPGDYPCATSKPDEYGRLLVDLLLPAGNFSDLMIRAGHAAPYPAKKV